MCNVHGEQPELLIQACVRAKDILRLMQSFGLEYGLSVLQGVALPPQAAEDLSVLLQESRNFRLLLGNPQLKVIIDPN